MQGYRFMIHNKHHTSCTAPCITRLYNVALHATQLSDFLPSFTQCRVSDYTPSLTPEHCYTIRPLSRHAVISHSKVIKVGQAQSLFVNRLRNRNGNKGKLMTGISQRECVCVWKKVKVHPFPDRNLTICFNWCVAVHIIN